MSEPMLVPVAYDQFVSDVHTIAIALAASGWTPDHIVGIGRGGLVPGAYLSHRTGISLLSVDYSAGVPGFSDELLLKLAGETGDGTRILLIDDINDSGKTILALRAAIDGAGGDPACLRVAVLIDNLRSPAQVDYRARTIDRAEDKSWFVFPWEAMAPRETLVEEAEEVPERLA
ncbi:phosphoribosyltransferase family protein [Sphingomonas sp. BIUV-7]|uniref:Phosphoribosyltransferase family protein n=1 Tax=Sphingomonas natans TaxID=3063330 RepID=A0ABT8YBB8_9SPHN|nr:phosphoribosyltransferase family protein [Sphingomonas sp. BIUV-7]MDO6415628.1 phosphoribosyltransferase family protein [Sphingomonas sp. BIUV-7]